MNRIHTLVAALGLVAVTAPVAASAQGWQPINARQAQLDRRIDQGIRSGALTRGEAQRLRNEARQIASLEGRYRRTGGLQQWERRDLDRRFDALSQRIRFDKNDRRHYR